jgi:DNA-binding CsgD family transcriptional regulator
MENVTSRELEVLRLIAAGQSTKQVAFQLGIAFKTAASHRYHLIEKLGAANTADLMCRATRRGLLDLFALPSADVGSTPLNLFGRRIVAIRQEAGQRRLALAAAVSRSGEIRKRHQEVLDELNLVRERTLISVQELLHTFREWEIRPKSGESAVRCPGGGYRRTTRRAE